VSRIAVIAKNDAMILPYDANPGRMQYLERTARLARNLANTGWVLLP
jgi:hypothetical protein